MNPCAGVSLGFIFKQSMKKFCSSCGNQLELSQRYCSECGIVNPFFVPAFILLSDQSDVLEKLRIEKEKIEKELAEKEEKQAEFVRQEMNRRELDEHDRRRKEILEKEMILRDTLEREKFEASFKEEILRVKEETEQHKQETVDMLRQMRDEIQQQIEQEHNRLKQEFELVRKEQLVPEHVDTAEPSLANEPVQKKKPKSSGALLLLLAVLTVGIGLAYFYFTNIYTSSSTVSQSAEKPSSTLEETPTINHDTLSMAENAAASETASTIPQPIAEASLAEASNNTTTEGVKKENRNSVPVTNTVYHEPSLTKRETVPVPRERTPAINESKVLNDLVGKRISGCGVTINSSDEVQEISNLVFVETLPSGYKKYKFKAKIEQGGDSYNATPYIYYSADGGFIKIDGTNCE